ncbi:alpha/beta fold hydrolase [Actinoplanes awajinensis]|uniref:Sigma factor sigB regulation protein rsbQ n=1 Tax=Actinoplanes awajinensis subsp. mycoplanecinus TaxID=135947 RepID=A0A0X3VGL0_9ACTN|nr:alpha/beta hydrolase [Actinoplanes awajinensis]KUL42516.1 sigma factor sigB regulation protein rsbQ [Actinoplanes awajinensis subsp. mycoplanecinus]
MGTTQRNAVTMSGRESGQPMLFAHGYGCDQNMWRLVTPAFAGTHRIVSFDHVGNGRSDLTAYDDAKYASLDGYATDVLEIVHEHDLHDVVFVGHSVSSMIGLLAAVREPERFAGVVMIGPSPRYINDEAAGYVGGFGREDIDQMLVSLDSNFLGWSSVMAPVIMGNPERPELGEELTNSFCRTDPEIAKKFARVTFLSDNRDDLPKMRVPSLVLQCSDDVIAPSVVGEYVHKNTPQSTFAALNATGHCPNLSAPEETVDAIKSWL